MSDIKIKTSLKIDKDIMAKIDVLVTQTGEGKGEIVEKLLNRGLSAIQQKVEEKNLSATLTRLRENVRKSAELLDQMQENISALQAKSDEILGKIDSKTGEALGKIEAKSDEAVIKIQLAGSQKITPRFIARTEPAAAIPKDIIEQIKTIDVTQKKLIGMVARMRNAQKTDVLLINHERISHWVDEILNELVNGRFLPRLMNVSRAAIRANYLIQEYLKMTISRKQFAELLKNVKASETDFFERKGYFGDKLEAMKRA